MEKSTLEMISGGLFITGFIPYILAIFGRNLWFRRIKQTRPQKSTWIVWTGLDLITLAGMALKGTATGQIIGAVIGGSIVTCLAFAYGIPGWRTLDKAVIIGGIIGVAAGYAYGDANITILVSAVIIVLGSIPTFISAWKQPENEDKTAWTIYTVSCVVALFAISAWTIEHSAQVLSFTLVETTMMFILFVVPRLRAALAG